MYLKISITSENILKIFLYYIWRFFFLYIIKVIFLAVSQFISVKKLHIFFLKF